MNFSKLFEYYKKKPSRQIVNNSLYFIRKEFSALDFIPQENILKTNKEKESDLRVYYISSIVEKWIAVIILGIFVGILGAFQSIAIEEMFMLKYTSFSKSFQTSATLAGFIWIIWTIIPIVICCFLVIVEPTLKGSGVASTIAYLNGVRIRRFHKGRTLWLQYLSTFLISAGNMPGGKEELFIFVGALSGAAITRLRIPFIKWRPFSGVCDPINRRALVAAGMAAGVAVSFGTPIGAVLFCLEEGLTFWSTELTFLMFLCSICSNFVLHSFYTIYSNRGVFVNDFTYNLFFAGVDHIKLTYKLIEIPIFVLMGAFGGLLGSIWNEVHIKLYRVRKINIKNKKMKFLEVFFLGLLVSLWGILAFHMFGAECQTLPKSDLASDNRQSRSKQMKTYCKDENQFESVGLFLFQDLRYVMKSILMAQKDLLNASVILFGATYYFIFSELQFGTHLTSGVLVPQLVCGAGWGYLLGIWCGNMTGESVVAKYAFLGAVAQGCGVTRLSISLGLIMVESCGKQAYAIPIFIIVVTAKWFGGIFSRPFYCTEAYLEGYPFLRATFLPLTVPYKAQNIMAAPLVSVSRNISVQELINVLKTGHQTFPVLQNKKVIGAIKKYQIAIILKTKSFNLDNPEEIRIMYESLQEFQGESFTELGEIIQAKEDLNKIVDLQNIMNPSPYLINKDMSLRKIYLMFLALGLPYVIVVDNSLDAIGIITRKDVASYRKLSVFFLLRTEIISII